MEKIIISLTTIPSRLFNIKLVINSILNQIIKPDEIVLVLPTVSFREQKDQNIDPYNITDELLNYINTNNITLLRPNYDYGPIMKLLPVLLREKENKSDNIIITIDDDKIYFNNTIEDLINGYKRNNCVCVRKGALLVFDELNINSKINIKEKPIRSADLIEDKQINFLYGTGGVLYKPNFFEDNILNEVKNLPKEGFYVDDVVISVLLMKNNIKIVAVKSIKNEYQKKYDNVRCGIMDESTSSNNINRLAKINYANCCHNNIFMINYYKKEIMDYINKNNISL